MQTPSARLAACAILTVVLGAGPAAAASYPTNACVGAKLKHAGRYCGNLLRAWSAWERSGDAAARDALLATAQARLERGWASAEARATAAGAGCTETTLSVEELGLAVGTATAQVVELINAPLDLEDPADARCGSTLLRVAAKQCQMLLGAEGTHVNDLAGDADGTRLAATVARAGTAFERAWNQVTTRQCTESAAGEAVASVLDTLAADLVRDTTISPNVDESRFTTISPVGPITYQEKVLSPTCIAGTPYHFFVRRGTVNKLLMYYQGGGACWEQTTCGAPVCDANVNPNGSDNPNNATSGFADRTNPENPFRDWHVVFVSYCSCDIHFGDAARDYTNANPGTPLHIEHRGYHNARVAEKWAREHFVNPEEVFVTGSSAGAYGAWFNAPLLHDAWPASQFHVLGDAGNGVITQDFLDEHFPTWNFESNLPDDIPGLQEVLDSGAGIPGYTELVADFFPQTTWAHYTTAFDGGSGGQTGFYNLMLNDNNIVGAVTWWEGSCSFTEQMRAQAIATAEAVPDNYRYYIGTGSRHTMWGSNKVYTDTTGGVPTIVDWVNAMLASRPPLMLDPGWTNVECENCGLLLPGDPRPSPLQPPFAQVGGDVVIQCE